jgi:putative ABC transport system permease protein
MIRNYIRTAWRNLSKSRFYTLINVGGLSVGLTIGILLLLWIQDEFSYDTFHRNSSHIYKLENMVGTGTSRQLWAVTTAPIGVLAKNQIPGVEMWFA